MLTSLRESLRLKLIIAVITVASLIHGVFSAIKIYEDRAAALRQMEQTKEKVLTELAYGLADPLWNFDFNQAIILAKLKLQERDFIGITIHDLETKEIMFSLVKTDDKIVEVNDANFDYSTVVSIDIKKNNITFWQADCYFTDQYVNDQIYRNIRYSVAVNIVLTAILTVLLIIMLNFMVIRPIHNTTAVIKRIVEGDFSSRISVRQTDEIGEIGNEVNSLLDQLESTISQVNLVMEAMAEGDFSKQMTGDLAGDLAKLKNHTNRSIEILFERTLELKVAQQELIDKAHKAGMADVASGTLHNVGNILNSVKVSAQVIHNDLNHSHIDNFQKANDLLRKHFDSLEDFILNNPKGKQLLEYYLKLEEVLLVEKEQIRSNLVRLNDKIDMIADVILAQQNYAGISSYTKEVSLNAIIEDALTLQSGPIERYGIQVVKNISAVSLVPVQKAKLVHILINLIKNAKESMLHSPLGCRKLTITVDQTGDCARLKIADTGKGIDESHLQKIFSHGYTTKKGGHGFGLHSCANYMAEMKGKIRAESNGLNQGATFILEFSLPKKSENS